MCGTVLLYFLGVSSRILCIKVNEGDGEEKERFRNDQDRVGNGYRLSVLGYLNG